MKTRKIIADSMPQAIKMVRQQLGDHAIIVNTRAFKKGGFLGLFAKEKYEVTAYAVDKDNDRMEPKYVLERKEKPEKKMPEKAQHQQQNVNPQKADNGSGFHKKPQNLYSYYSQAAPEKDVPNSLTSEVTDRDSFQTIIAAQKMDKQPAAPVNENSDFQSIGMEQLTASQTAVATEISVSKPDETAQLATVANKEHTKELPSKQKEDAVLDELQQMRKMMMTLMMKETQGNGLLPAGLTPWVNRLKKQGACEEVIEHIMEELLKTVEAVEEADDAVIKNAIASIITRIIEKRIPESNTISEGTRMINIVGPTGVGKTTSIAKLATEQVLKQKRRVAMVTTDVYRIAAVEQLKTYAGILNVPFEVVRSAEELVRVLENLKHYDLIYMDTTGRNYKNAEFRESINGYLKHSFESENYLVLSLTTKYEDMEILLVEFLTSPIKKLILTKFDETSSFGSILNIAYKYPYELAYITNGQSVPEDIAAVDAAMLASYLVGEEK